MKVYKLRHKASGLYYQPNRGRGNLSLKGKIYPKEPNLDWVETIRIELWVTGKSRLAELIINHFKPKVSAYGKIDCYIKTNHEDWEIVEL